MKGHVLDEMGLLWATLNSFARDIDSLKRTIGTLPRPFGNLLNNSRNKACNPFIHRQNSPIVVKAGPLTILYTIDIWLASRLYSYISRLTFNAIPLAYG